jgi:hypothetical protein
MPDIASQVTESQFQEDQMKHLISDLPGDEIEKMGR